MSEQGSASGSKPHSDALDWQVEAEEWPDGRAPARVRPFLRLRWKALVNVGLLLVGLVVQVVLVQMMYELVDLCISLMEVWAELARKHLEITLSAEPEIFFAHVG